MSTLTGLKTSEFNTGNTALGSDVLYNDQLIANFINGGNFDLTNISASMSPAWTGTHTFEALKIKIKGGGAGVLALQYATSASNRSYTIPDAGANANFILDTGDSNFDSGTLFIDATNNKVLVGSTSTVYSPLLQVIKSSAGGDVDLAAINTDNTNASSRASIVSLVGGSSAGDPKFLLTVLGVTDWYVAIDNSDSDKLKFGTGTSVGTNTALSIDTSLNVRLEPAKKFYLDGGGDTYIWEESANLLTCSVGGVNTFSATSSQFILNSVCDFLISSTKQFFLDGGSNTSIRERTADTITFKLGGSDLVEIASTGEVSLPAVDPPSANKLNSKSGIKGYGGYSEAGASTFNLYNVSSVTDSASAGVYTINWNTVFTNGFFTVFVTPTTPGFIGTATSSGGSQSTINITDAAGTLTDDTFTFGAFGTQ